MLARQSNDAFFCVNKKFSIHTILLNLFFISGVCGLIYPVPPVESLPFESLRALSLSNGQVERQNAPHVSAGINVVKFLEGQRPKATDLSPWYGVSEVVWDRMLTLVMGQKEGVQCIR